MSVETVASVLSKKETEVLITVTVKPNHVEETSGVSVLELSNEQVLVAIDNLKIACQEYLKIFLALNKACQAKPGDFALLARRDEAREQLIDKSHYLITLQSYPDDSVVFKAFEAFCQVFCVYRRYPSIMACRQHIDTHFGVG